MEKDKLLKQKDMNRVIGKIYLLVIMPMFALLLLNAITILFYSKITGCIVILLDILITYFLLRKMGFVGKTRLKK